MLKLIGRGVFRSVIITVVMLMFMTIAVSLTEVSSRIISVYYLVVTCLSVVYGAAYASKKYSKKGWLIGLLTAFFYMGVIYGVSFVFYQDITFGSSDLIRILIALIVGLLSGMLGINI